ncbi:MAG: right-handed parallel beta-helix repeat-containing protein [Verrucomicrobia bacterium]|nr:right-handed parallel beta-helix repeat-containing protein [Verrucomicrobiota bacterium]
MKWHERSNWRAWLVVFAAQSLLSSACSGSEHKLYVSPTGDDQAAGTQRAPFRTLYRAQEAARALTKDMRGDVVVNLAPGKYRLSRTLEFTEADSGKNGFHVIYRSAAGPGKARLLGSVHLNKGWQPYRDGIWKISTPSGLRFHTLYEKGQRAWKARFPNHEYVAGFPTARGRYLRTEDGCRALVPGGGKLGDAWLVYRAEDAPPVTQGPQMRLAIFDCGKCDWMRCIYRIREIDPQTRRLVFMVDESPYGQLANEKFRVLGNARFFLEDELGLLDAPGEFFHDEKSNVLYYKPRHPGRPDSLNITMPVVDTLVRVQGANREACVSHLRFEGLSLEETNDFPRTWWNCDYGRKDAALIWLSNCYGVEILKCRLINSGRSGIMFIGHNIENRVEGCLIEHMGVNGITLCNRFLADDGKSATPDISRGNRVHNCRIHDIGEIHCYASCINVFNTSDNQISHCELFNSVRYALTLRGNTNAQFVQPHVFNNLPKCRGNVFHHLDIHHCGQDSGDMGAVHAANLNIPGGDAVNTFEQIVVADMQSYPSMIDLPPDGIFLDWPSKSMQQVFRNFQIVRVAGKQLRSHKPENGDSAVTENVSWKPDFREDRMDHANIGVTADFPAAYGGRPVRKKKH